LDSFIVIKHFTVYAMHTLSNLLHISQIMQTGVNVIKKFPSSLMMRPNKLEGLSLETLSSEVLEFEGKARAYPIGVPFRCFLLG
jgi:hypothetical protein